VYDNYRAWLDLGATFTVTVKVNSGTLSIEIYDDDYEEILSSGVVVATGFATATYHNTERSVKSIVWTVSFASQSSAQSQAQYEMISTCSSCVDGRWRDLNADRPRQLRFPVDGNRYYMLWGDEGDSYYGYNSNNGRKRQHHGYQPTPFVFPPVPPLSLPSLSFPFTFDTNPPPPILTRTHPPSTLPLPTAPALTPPPTPTPSVTDYSFEPLPTPVTRTHTILPTFTFTVRPPASSPVSSTNQPASSPVSSTNPPSSTQTPVTQPPTPVPTSAVTLAVE
jgi:hypothetical protein